jgi:putative hydrolase of the HAD superfamily
MRGIEDDNEIRAIFFDFGGVLARLDRAMLAAYEERHGLPAGSFLEALYRIPEWRALEVGQGDEDAWMAAAKRKLDEIARRPLPDITEERQTMWRRLDGDVIALARRLKERYRLGVLSNATARLESELNDFHRLGDLFDVVVNSFRVGMAKPDPRIYALAAERMGVSPTACVHIDDLPHNVEGAREAGFRAVHHKGDYPTLEVELRSLGVVC